MVVSVARTFRAESFVAPGVVMTPVIFITIGFLSCWFLLYALMAWTQDPQRKPGVRRAGDTAISQKQRRSQQVVNFRSKERL